MKSKLTVWSEHHGRYLSRAECARIERAYRAAAEPRGSGTSRQVLRALEALRADGLVVSLAAVRAVLRAADILRGPGSPGLRGGAHRRRAATILALRRAGKTWRAVGRALGITEEAARAWARRHGVA